MSLENVISFISKCRINAVVEKQAQADIEAKLDDSNFKFEREYRLSERDIVDFVVHTDTGLIAIELKIKAQRMSIYRQLCRYAKHDEVAAVVLLTGTAMNLPALIENKPAAVISLGEAWL
ncbi:hypothetical protein [Shewanella sp. MM_2022_3]|uniref:hypothetical protein n=1 Tax=Shewanella sp. MM_2022_3 TaxID=2923280 RepID=UPI001F4BCF7C|nr:hypothetical protein [Shewanella sp. MM_2022_3]MCH7421259.1 hypothetical protein [Shewanella sp. MM_2022_3]